MTNLAYGATTSLIFTDVYAWACECRIGPDHLISTDRRDWIPAAEVADLDLVWQVELVDGTLYGPVNAHAVPHLIRDAAVAPEARATNVLTGETSRAAEVAATTGGNA